MWISSSQKHTLSINIRYFTLLDTEQPGHGSTMREDKLEAQLSHNTCRIVTSLQGNLTCHQPSECRQRQGHDSSSWPGHEVWSICQKDQHESKNNPSAAQAGTKGPHAELQDQHGEEELRVGWNSTVWSSWYSHWFLVLLSHTALTTWLMLPFLSDM